MSVNGCCVTKRKRVLYGEYAFSFFFFSNACLDVLDVNYYKKITKTSVCSPLGACPLPWQSGLCALTIPGVTPAGALCSWQVQPNWTGPSGRGRTKHAFQSSRLGGLAKGLQEGTVKNCLVMETDKYSIKLKLKLYQSCVLLTLLYGSECWRMTEHDLAKLSSFHMASLRKIQHIFRPRTISNGDLLARCQQEDMETIITRKRRCWIGHVLHEDANSTTEVATTGPTKEGRSMSTKDNLAENCGSRNKEPQLGHNPEAGQWDRGGGALLLPYTPASVTGSDDDDKSVDLEITQSCDIQDKEVNMKRPNWLPFRTENSLPGAVWILFGVHQKLCAMNTTHLTSGMQMLYEVFFTKSRELSELLLCGLF